MSPSVFLRDQSGSINPAQHLGVDEAGSLVWTEQEGQLGDGSFHEGEHQLGSALQVLRLGGKLGWKLLAWAGVQQDEQGEAEGVAEADEACHLHGVGQLWDLSWAGLGQVRQRYLHCLPAQKG